VDLVASIERASLDVLACLELSYKATGQIRSGQARSVATYVLASTSQVLPLINGMTFQPQTTTIPALFPFAIVVITTPKGTKENGMKRSS
jgi:hypothetical protein